MEFTDWIQIVAEVGVLVMCAALIGYAVYTGINSFKKWFDIKLSKDKIPKHDETMKTRLRINPEVKGVLKELRLQTHASRAYVFEFHNGTTSLGGLPFIYMSNTYEVLGQMATSQMHARQHMPFTLYDSLIDRIMQDDVVTVDTRSKTGEFDSIIYETLEKRGTTILIGTKLLDEHKRVIGFLGIDYCGIPDTAIIKGDENAIKEIEKIVFREAQALSTLFYVKISKEETMSSDQRKK
jgi:hypothetical protein